MVKNKAQLASKRPPLIERCLPVIPGAISGPGAWNGVLPGSLYFAIARDPHKHVLSAYNYYCHNGMEPGNGCHMRLVMIAERLASYASSPNTTTGQYGVARACVDAQQVVRDFCALGRGSWESITNKSNFCVDKSFEISHHLTSHFLVYTSHFFSPQI